MKIKRLLAAAVAATMMLSMAACGEKPAADKPAADGAPAAPAVSADRLKTVNVWATGSDNVRQIFEALVADFNANGPQKDKYQAKLNFLLSGSGGAQLPDMLNTAYQAKQVNTDYDVIDMGGDDLSRIVSLIGTEGFVKMDKAKMPNSSKVAAVSADASEYCQPYRGTTVVLAYNSKNVPEPPKTMDELMAWAKANPGRFAYNSAGTGGAGDSFVRTMIYNQIPDEAAMTSDDEKWTKEWDAGFAKLTELHPSIYQSGGKVIYPNKNQGALDLLANGEIDICPMWADMLLSQRAAGTVPEYIKLATITPSFTGSVQSMMIPNFGSNPEGGYAFIDYMLTDGAQEMLVKKMAAIPLIDTSKMDMTGYEDLAKLDVSKFRIMSIGELGKAINERWDNEIGTLG